MVNPTECGPWAWGGPEGNKTHTLANSLEDRPPTMAHLKKDCPHTLTTPAERCFCTLANPTEGVLDPEEGVDGHAQTLNRTVFVHLQILETGVFGKS